MARVLPAGFPRFYFLIYSMSYAIKNIKKSLSGSLLSALLDPMHYIIFGSHCHMKEVLQILCNALDYKEPTRGCQKVIFLCFLLQNSLNKLGNKSVGNPRVKPAPFPTGMGNQIIKSRILRPVVFTFHVMWFLKKAYEADHW